MKVLVINCGSSSIKYQLLDMPTQGDRAGDRTHSGTGRPEALPRPIPRQRAQRLAQGIVERIGEAGGRLTQRWRSASGEDHRRVVKGDVTDHQAALQRIVTALSISGAVAEPGELDAVGHRVVNGGESFRTPVQVDDRVLQRIEAVSHLAPLHNPANLLGIRVALEVFPNTPQVAVFDTAFHHSLPPHAYRYALPTELYERHFVRRYGFHGTSFRYVARQAAELLARPLAEVNLIAFHLGNGASAAAIAGGKSVDTSMGMTPLEGLMMGTRCGDLDPAVALYLARETPRSPDAVEALLNQESGLKGVCGAYDMREVHRRAEAGDERAELALAMYAYRIRKYLGAYYAVLGRVDAVLFTGGIGENDGDIRERVCTGLERLGIRLDPQANAEPSGEARRIEAAGAEVAVLVVPTDEELEIAMQTVECLEGH